MRRALLLMAFATLSSCALFNGPKPPDLTARYRTVKTITGKVGQIRQIMDADLHELESLSQAFLDVPATIYAPPFPVDLFKQTAMSCLNQPVSENAQEETGAEEALMEIQKLYGRTLTCNPAELPYCLKALVARAPGHLSIALEQLERVDTLRKLHAKLRKRTLDMPLIIRQQRELLATRRADWRQVNRDLQRQREEFTQENWKTARERLDSYKMRIDRFARSIDALETASTTWTQRVQGALDRFYIDLAGLYDRAPGTLRRDPSRTKPL